MVRAAASAAEHAEHAEPAQPVQRGPHSLTHLPGGFMMESVLPSGTPAGRQPAASRLLQRAATQLTGPA